MHMFVFVLNRARFSIFCSRNGRDLRKALSISSLRSGRIPQRCPPDNRGLRQGAAELLLRPAIGLPDATNNCGANLCSSKRVEWILSQPVRVLNRRDRNIIGGAESVGLDGTRSTVIDAALEVGKRQQL
jgi:hypothetical protein